MKKKILFVCSANLNRSPTFEKYFKKILPKKDWEVRSAGIWHGVLYQVNEEILEWADKVFVMDMSHYFFIFKHYYEYIDKVVVVGISDEYNPDEDKLIELIEFWKNVFWRKAISDI